LKRFAVKHTPNFVKLDKQTMVSELRIVAEDSSILEESKSIHKQRRASSKVSYEESKSKIHNATLKIPSVKNRIKFLVL
jgi:hypothetical protein